MLKKLQSEAIAALKAGNKFRKLTLSTLIAQVKKAAIDAGCRDNITDEMVIQVLKKEKKNLVDAVEKFPDMPVEKKANISTSVSSLMSLFRRKFLILTRLPILFVKLLRKKILRFPSLIRASL